MRKIIILCLLGISTVCFLPSAHAKTAEDVWLPKFISRLDSASQPAKLLANIQPSAPGHEKIQLLAKYFRAKSFLKPNWVIEVPDLKDATHDTQLADNAAKNLIYSMYGVEQFGESLPWFGKDKKVRTLARFPHFDYLAPAYFHTGNETYARTMVRHMEDFINNAPIELAANVNVQTNYTTNPWNWVLQHWRIMRWVDALAFLKKSPSLPDSTYLRILLHLWEEVDWLVPRMNLGLHNGTLGNLRGILYTGLNFPEAANGLYWQNEALSLFKSFLSTYFYPGEVSVELTLGYSSAVLAQCLNIYQALPPSKQKQAIGKVLEDLVNGHLGLMKPDRSLPRYGDHGNFDLRVSLLEKAGKLFARPDLLWLTSEDSNAMPPPFLSFPAQSQPYYLSGYYAMRDGWGKEAQYLSMDAGPFGTNHQHADKLSITVSADGANFIVDPGTSIYNSTEPGPRYDLRFGFLHNSITVDGIDQNAGWEQHYQFDVLDNRWVTNAAYDFIEGSYDYRSSGLDVIHARTILYKRGEYWLLLDALKGTGTHNVQSNLQFMFDIDLSINSDGIAAHAANGAELQIISTADDLTPAIVKGDTARSRTRFPVRYPNIDHIPGGRGWVGVFGNNGPYNPNHSYPSPALVFSGDVALPHYSLRVLAPSKNKKIKPFSISWLERQANHIRAKLEHLGSNPPTIDILDMTSEPKISDRKPPRDESGFLLRLVDGSPTEIIFMNDDEIEYKSNTSHVKLRFSEHAEGFLTRNGNDWRLFIDTCISRPLKILEFKNTEYDKMAEIYLKSGESNLRLIDETGKPVLDLWPGRTYILTAN